ncbi:MAG: hypothetical protein JNM07_04295 [Phycisphaerae bacterium]|nr:hypothetical protein [Phycisphaerae bacterium]
MTPPHPQRKPDPEIDPDALEVFSRFGYSPAEPTEKVNVSRDPAAQGPRDLNSVGRTRFTGKDASHFYLVDLDYMPLALAEQWLSELGFTRSPDIQSDFEHAVRNGSVRKESLKKLENVFFYRRADDGPKRTAPLRVFLWNWRIDHKARPEPWMDQGGWYAPAAQVARFALYSMKVETNPAVKESFLKGWIRRVLGS